MTESTVFRACARGQLPSLSTRDVSLISSSLEGRYCALVESAGTCFAEHASAGLVELPISRPSAWSPGLLIRFRAVALQQEEEDHLAWATVADTAVGNRAGAGTAAAARPPPARRWPNPRTRTPRRRASPLPRRTRSPVPTYGTAPLGAPFRRS